MGKTKKRKSRAREGGVAPDNRGAPQQEPGGLRRLLTREFLFSREAGLALLLVIAVIAAYIPAIEGGFIWDDPEYVINNPALRTLGGLKDIWFEPGATPQYYPLVFTTFWIEYHFWELDPFGYHLVNVLLHAGSAVLLFLLLRRLGVPGAWLAAAIFALHPVNVESAAWITERKNVLSAFLYLGAFMAFLRYALPGKIGNEDSAESANRGPGKFYVLAAVLFLGALLSKTVTCTFPAAILLVLWWKRGRIGRDDVLASLPFFGLGIVFACVTVWMEKFHVGAMGDEWSLTLFEKLLLAGRIVCFYAYKLVLPLDLIFFYPRWNVDAGVWWQYVFPLGVAAAVVLLWLARRRLGRGPLVAVLFFCGTLVPALGFFNVYPMRFSFVADHFQYLAGIGLIALFAAAAVTAAARLPAGHRQKALVAAAALLVVLGVLAHRQGGIYKDQETLWRDTLERNPAAWIAHSNLGEILVAQGKIDEALAHCRAALRLKPDLPEAHGNLANALYHKKEFAEAVERFEEVLRLDPGNARAYGNMGAALEALERFDEAEAAYNEALRISPGYAGAHYNLGNTLFKLERFGEAGKHYAEAARLDPKFADAHFRLGLSLQKEGRAGEAVRAYRRTLELRPGWLEAANNLAWLLAVRPGATAEDGAEAVTLAEQLCRATNRRAPEVLDTLAAAYARVERFAAAEKTAGEALALARSAGMAELANAIARRQRAYGKRQAWEE